MLFGEFLIKLTILKFCQNIFKVLFTISMEINLAEFVIEEMGIFSGNLICLFKCQCRASTRWC